MRRREFLQVLAAGAASGLRLDARAAVEGDDAGFYAVPPFGNASVLHITDSHAQLLPTRFREPDANLGVGPARGRPPHLVGEALLRHFGVPAHSRQAHAFTHLEFEFAARRFGRVGGYAHLATLLQRLRADRPGALLLDGGDTWQGSATALWTRGEDMARASVQLGVDVMTGHWEFTYGAERVRELIDGPLAGRIDFVAQNVRTADFGDEVFPPYVIKEVQGTRIAVVGQAFPYTPIANPSHLIPDWTFGIQEENLQKTVDSARAAGAAIVLLLSHNGADVDLKLASRVSGITAILGGHTHDGIPAALEVSNRGGRTLVTNAGCNGKFVGVLDLDIRQGGLADYRYRLLPVFADLLPPDPDMQSLIDGLRAPFASRLARPVARTEGLLYRRGNFSGTFDQVILDALMEVKGAQIAFSPGFRWGPTLLPGETITVEDLMAHTAITYPHVTLSSLTGEQIKTILEDVADNLFHPDPYYQQGGDMVRVGGLRFSIAPRAGRGKRIDHLRLGAEPLDAQRTYKVAGWAPVAEGATGDPVWEVVEAYLRGRSALPAPAPLRPEVVGEQDNPGLAQVR